LPVRGATAATSDVGVTTQALEGLITTMCSLVNHQTFFNLLECQIKNFTEPSTNARGDHNEVRIFVKITLHNVLK